MPITYKINIVAALKEAGYNSNVIRQEKIMGQRELQKLRHNELVSWATIETICKLLDCQREIYWNILRMRKNKNK